jgi:hypothetical protein
MDFLLSLPSQAGSRKSDIGHINRPYTSPSTYMPISDFREPLLRVSVPLWCNIAPAFIWSISYVY